MPGPQSAFLSDTKLLLRRALAIPSRWLYCARNHVSTILLSNIAPLDSSRPWNGPALVTYDRSHLASVAERVTAERMGRVGYADDGKVELMDGRISTLGT